MAVSTSSRFKIFNLETITMITINVPDQVETNQNFVIQGTASNDLLGKPVELIIDNQFKISGGNVAEDGTWQINFVFLSPGDRRLKIAIGDEINTAYAQIKVIQEVPDLRITHFPTILKTLEPFVIKGEADNLEDGEELLIRIDGRFNVANPIVEGGKWDAQIVLSQGGSRLLEVIASDQEQIQKTIKVTCDDDLTIITRQVWGASPTPGSLPNLKAKRITIHHTVYPTLSPNASQATEFQRMRSIYDLHVNHNKWSDIGYHYVIMPSGRVYEGRYDKKRGAHDKINDGFGVAFEGSYHLPGSMITEAQFQSAVKLCTRLCKRIGITDPTVCVSTRTAFAGNPYRKLPLILGHRDRYAGTCPGMPNGTSVRLEEIRQVVKATLS
jgi:hypothetical protein